MRKVSALFLIAAMAAAGLSAQVKGPIVDKILLDAKTSEDIAIKDVAVGKSDLFNYGSSGGVYKGLPADIQAKLDPYAVTGALYEDLYINPYPNKAPYTGKNADGKAVFNPFAIREVRFAMNFLINRKKIIDEILVGAGQPMFTPVVPGQPNSSRFGLLAQKMGMTPTGNEAKALKDIDAALQKAAAADSKLVKKGDWWTYDGSPVSVKYLIRADDPNIRVPLGHYISDQIEKAGIKVEKLEYTRAKCTPIWNGSNPAELQWNMYTSAWGGGGTTAFFEGNIGQMYAPYRGDLPGGGKAGFWQYENAEMDTIAQATYNGAVKDVAEYYTKLFKQTNMGLQEAIRVFLCATTSYTPANKDRFNSRMLWGAGDGIDNFSLYSADVKPETSGPDKGLKVLKMSEYSANGQLFMSSWDPVGPDGFSDTYTAAVIRNVSDAEIMYNPVTGLAFPATATWKDLKTNITDFTTTPFKGGIIVPPEAVLYNSRTQKWESGINYADIKGDGSEYDYVKVAAGQNTAWSQGTFTFKFGKWHDGRAMDINDYRYSLSRPYEVALKKGENDKLYEESYGSSLNAGLSHVKGYVFNKDNTITVYSDVSYPMDQGGLAALLCPSLLIEASNYGDMISWPIHEALKSMVAEGAASGETWVFNSNGDFTEVDLLAQNCVADIQAKLKDLAANKVVPDGLVGYVTPAQAADAYTKALAFVDAHGHAVISNGGFVIDKYDPKNFTMVMTAYRDKAYPFEQGWFTKTLSTSFIRIDRVNVGTYAKGKDLTVSASLSQVAFPAGTSVAAAKANFKVTLISDKEVAVVGKITKAGSAEATIKAADLANLKPGSYTIVVEAALGTDAGAVETANLIVF